MRFTLACVPRAVSRLAVSVTMAGTLVALLGSAQVAQASSSCPNELFRTGPGANLPDCRAYELVSPSQKNGGEVDGGPEFEVVPAPQQAAANGGAITYGSQTAFPDADPTSSSLTTQYISRREASGWRTEAITPEQDFPGGVFDKEFGSEEFNLFQGFSENLEHAFLAAYEPSPVPGAPAGYFNPYLRDNANSSYQLLSTVTPPVVPPGPADGQKAGLTVEYAGMSNDGSHVVFQADDALTPGALPGSTQGGVGHVQNLYEWSDGHLELVSVLPANEGGKAVDARFGAIASASNVSYGEDGNRVVSDDGSRVTWTNLTEENGGPSQLYLHELTPAGPRTVRISASHRSPEDPTGPQAAIYWTASVDGSEVFFTSCTKLTDDSTAQAQSCSHTNGEPSKEGEDLYRYDATTGELSDLTVDPVAGQTASVAGVLGASEDGSYVYFVAQGALVKGAPSGAGIYNIYSWHDGTTSLIASTTRSDYLLGVGSLGRFEALKKGQELLAFGTVRVSPDGRYLAFQSSEPLTGYDNQPVQAGACTAVTSFFAGGIYANEEIGTGRCVEVYEYDAAAGRLTCASCDPEGLPPVGDSIVPMPLHVLGQLAGWQSTTDQQRYLLDDGRLFFDSTDELLPQASNAGEMNVYEYEPGAVGDCQREGGCLALISSGTSNENSFFIDASASGDDVFMVSRQSLVAQDGDEALDMYDARVDGGFLAPPTPPCGGEACRAPVTPAPAIYQAPPSATFVGPGNPPTPPVLAPVSKAKKSKVKSKAKRAKSVRSKRKHVGKGKKTARRSRLRRPSRGRRG
jgi:hypothetical protein